MSTKEMMHSTESYLVQKTLATEVYFEGIGLHSGKAVKLRMVPSEPGTGIAFYRIDHSAPKPIVAHYTSVVCTELATTLGSPEDPSQTVATVEHVLAAVYALGVTNVRIEVSGREIPILDGSAKPFVDAILKVGLVVQPYSARMLRVLKPIRIYQKGAVCELLPRDSLRLTTSVDFSHPCIGSQTFAVELTPQVFAEQISEARTFGFIDDIDRLRARELALGASLENVLGFSETEIMNPEGVRFEDECVRHKLLDAIGDLALCGGWIAGEMVSFRGGHSMHLALLKALESQPSSWEWVEPEPLYVPAGARESSGVPSLTSRIDPLETFLNSLN